MPRVVAELGPGNSMGTGLAALIAGASQYYALDLIDHSNTDANLRIFDELIELFKGRASIPASGSASLIYPDLEDYGFPKSLEPQIARLSTERIDAIRTEIKQRSGRLIHAAAPWTAERNIAPGSIDWIISHAVLEHVDDVGFTCSTMSKWLRQEGYASHLVDFDSHGLTREWNGHWAIDSRLWTALRGKRPYLLNRISASRQLALAQQAGFSVVLEKRNKRYDGLVPDDFAEGFRDMSDEDARTRMMFTVMQLRRQTRGDNSQY
jgi:hypothetical protein